MKNTLKKYLKSTKWFGLAHHKKILAGNAGALLIAFALLASAGILLSFQGVDARCLDDNGEPIGSCQPSCYSEGPAPDPPVCNRSCGDGNIQRQFGEDCDPGSPGGSTPTCDNTCQNIALERHSICNASEACQEVAGPGTNECAIDSDCRGTSNAWVDITITANTTEAGWNLKCPSPWGPYSCDGVGGSGDYHFYPDAQTRNGAIAGVGYYGVDPVINTVNYVFEKIGAGSSANPAYRGTRPPASVSFYWDLVYKPKFTDPTTPVVTTKGTVDARGGACTIGSDGYTAVISWTGTPASYGFYVDISDTPTFTDFRGDRYWRKTVVSGLTTNAPDSGFVLVGGWPWGSTLKFLADVTYYVRVTGQGGTSGLKTFSMPLCYYSACNYADTPFTCVQKPGTSTDTCALNSDCATPPPACSFTAAPDRIVIPPPRESVLSWNCENVTSCSIDQGVGPVSASGTKGLFPEKTATYTLECAGLTGKTGTPTTTASVL
ncbi:MAG: hypothetical protein AAB867_00795, partial [Patescibacteria group bacterium]